MIKYIFHSSIYILILTGPICAQSLFFTLSKNTNLLTNRLEIKYPAKFGILNSFRSQTKSIIKIKIDSLNGEILNPKDSFNILYLKDEMSELYNLNNPKPFLKLFFTSGNKFLYFNSEKDNKNDYQLTVNPVFEISGGINVNKTSEISPKDTLFYNTRGLELFGQLGKNIGFYSFLSDNQIFVTPFMDSKIKKEGAVPGEGQWVVFKNKGYDFYSANGYLTFPISHQIQLWAGHGSHFIGNGFRSLVLSENATDFPYLKILTSFWKIQYTNLFTQMIDFKINKSDGEGVYPKKYFALHHLSILINNNLQIGFFESVINGLPDSLNGGFEISYLNPIIFYRSAERNLGSPHNGNLGMDFKFNFLKHFQYYGQILIDDYNFGERKNDNGWWGNKFAIQNGLKYIDFAGIKNLDFQFEYNRVQPYTYTHWYKAQNYSHFGQALAHPLGANFIEYVSILNYHPIKKLWVNIKYFNISQGVDSASAEWGSNIFGSGNPYQNYNNIILQGVTSKTDLVDITITYKIKYNLFFDLNTYFRTQTLPSITIEDKGVMIGLRMNIDRRENYF